MPKNEKLYKISNRTTDDKQGPRKSVNISDSGLYHKFAISGRKRCNTSSVIVQDNTFWSNNRRDFSRDINKIIQR